MYLRGLVSGMDRKVVCTCTFFSCTPGAGCDDLSCRAGQGRGRWARCGGCWIHVKWDDTGVTAVPCVG